MPTSPVKTLTFTNGVLDSNDLLIEPAPIVKSGENETPVINRIETVIDFDEIIDSSATSLYAEDQFFVWTTGPGFLATETFGMITSTGNQQQTVFTADGSAFDISSIALSEESPSDSPQTVYFTGFLADGGVVTQSYETQPEFEKEIVTLKGFNNLEVFEFYTPQVVFDDIVTTQSQQFSIAENSEIGTVVGTLLATDADSEMTSPSWQILGGSGQWDFEIDEATGEIVVRDDFLLDFENNGRFTLDVAVYNDGHMSDIETVVINLTDANDAPILDLNGMAEFGNEFMTVSNGAFASVVDSDLNITEDRNGSLFSAAVRITNALNGPHEFLSVDLDSATLSAMGLAVQYEASSSTLTITGEAAAEVYEQVLLAVKYTNNEQGLVTGDRTLEIIINDGELISSAGTTLSFNLIDGTTAGEILKGTNNGEIITGLSGNDTLRGRGGDDHLKGGTGNDRLFGEAGADHLDGGEGIDVAIYSGSAEAVTVDLSTNTADGGDATGDTFSSIERVFGSNFDDTLIGDDQNNTLLGLAGADRIDGGDGVDTVNYLNSDAAITIDLGNNSVDGGHATGDTLSNIERIFGSKFDDRITGDDRKNTLVGFAGNDVLDGGIGNDILDGRAGADTLTGGIGSDTFTVRALTDSLLTNFDIITDLTIGADRINTQNTLSSAQINQLGAVNALVETDLQAVLTETDFIADEAATFTLGNRTFLALNDGQNGYTASQDAVIEITGFSGDLTALTTI